MTTVTGTRISSSPSKESRGAQLDREISILNESEGSAIENHVAAGRSLRRIREHCLWAIRHCSYSEFLRNEAQIEPRNAARYVSISIKWEELQKSLPAPVTMPDRIAHLLALDKISPECRGAIWMEVLQRRQDGDLITPSLINRVALEGLAGSKINWGETKKISEEHIRSVEDARKRIIGHCGETLLRQIDHHKYRVTEKELIVWARQSDENLIAISRAVEKLGWTVSKALDALFKPLTPGTTMRELAALQIMRNRPVAIAFGGSNIRAEECL